MNREAFLRDTLHEIRDTNLLSLFEMEGPIPKHFPLREWPCEDRPREKLLRQGEHSLSNAELLAILLRTGVRGKSALDLARQVLQKFRTFRNMSHTDAAQWKEFKGLGSAKIAQIRAALEIGRRFREDEIKEDRPRINTSKDLVSILMPRMRDLKKEIVKVIFLNAQHRIIEMIDVNQGTVNQAHPILREIFQKALEHFAVSLICVHNHPSGDPTPSSEDHQFTKALCEAGRVLQIEVVDHIIIGDNCYHSFRDHGDIKK